MASDMACTSGMTGQDFDAYWPSRKRSARLLTTFFQIGQRRLKAPLLRSSGAFSNADSLGRY